MGLRIKFEQWKNHKEGGFTRSVEQLKTIERLMVEEIHNKGNYALMDELFSPDYIYHGPGEVEIKGIESYKKHNSMMRTVFPDYHLSITEMVIEGNTLMHHFTF